MIHSLLGFRNLDEENVRGALTKMASRSRAAGVLHACVYIVFFYFHLFYDEPFRLFTGFAILAIGATGRFVLTKHANQIFNLKHGVFRWRVLFTSNSVLMMTVWSYSISMCLIEHGFTSETYFFVATAIAIAGISTSAFAFDLVNNILCQIFLQLPIMITPLVLGYEMGIFSFSIAVYTMFCIYICFDLQKTNITMLENYEVTVSQKDLLSVINNDLSKANNIMETMFDSVDVAFVVFDLDGYCVNSPSGISEQIFGEEIIGKHISDIISNNDFDKEDVKNWYSLLCSGSHSFKNIAEIAPSKIIEDGRNLLLKFYPMLDENKEMISMILVARDITSELETSNKIEMAEVKSSLILRIYQSKVEFRYFIEEFSNFISTNLKPSDLDLSELSFSLHNWKTSARMNVAYSVAEDIHHAELKLAELRKRKINSADEIKKILLSIEKGFKDWISEEIELFESMSVFSKSKSVEISENDLEQIKKFIQKKKTTKEDEKILNLLTHDCLGDVFSRFEGGVAKAAKSLNKSVKLIVKKPESSVYIPRGSFDELAYSFMHIFNNCVDHGIESPEKRIEAEKEVIGKIYLSYQKNVTDHPGLIQILIKDDGRGINQPLLRERLESNGYDISQISDEKSLLMKIFEPSVSTKKLVNQFSGFGLGMSAVKNNIEAHDGSIDIVKSDSSGTTFKVLLPLNPRLKKLKVAA